MKCFRFNSLIILCIFALPGYAQFGVELGGGIYLSAPRYLLPSYPRETYQKYVKPKPTFVCELKGFYESEKNYSVFLMLDGGQYKYEINPLDEPEPNRFSHYLMEANLGFEKLFFKKRIGLVAGIQCAYLTHAKYELAEDYKVNIYNPFLISPGINLGMAWHFEVFKKHRFSLAYSLKKYLHSTYEIKIIKPEPYDLHTRINYQPLMSFNSFSLRYEIFKKERE